MSIDRIPIKGEVLDPRERKLVRGLTERISEAVQLSPWERRQLEWRLRREKEGLMLQLARVESETVLAEAVVAGHGRVAASLERAALVHIKQQLRCLHEAGEALDDSLAVAGRLTDDTRELMKGAMHQVVLNYAAAVERRAGAML